MLQTELGKQNPGRRLLAVSAMNDGWAKQIRADLVEGRVTGKEDLSD